MELRDAFEKLRRFHYKKPRAGAKILAEIYSNWTDEFSKVYATKWKKLKPGSNERRFRMYLDDAIEDMPIRWVDLETQQLIARHTPKLLLESLNASVKKNILRYDAPYMVSLAAIRTAIRSGKIGNLRQTELKHLLVKFHKWEKKYNVRFTQ